MNNNMLGPYCTQANHFLKYALSTLVYQIYKKAFTDIHRAVTLKSLPILCFKERYFQIEQRPGIRELKKTCDFYCE